MFLGVSIEVLSQDLFNVIEAHQKRKLKKIALEPMYLRASQAEIQREEKLNSGKAKRKN